MCVPVIYWQLNFLSYSLHPWLTSASSEELVSDLKICCKYDNFNKFVCVETSLLLYQRGET